MKRLIKGVMHRFHSGRSKCSFEALLNCKPFCVLPTFGLEITTPSCRFWWCSWPSTRKIPLVRCNGMHHLVNGRFVVVRQLTSFYPNTSKRYTCQFFVLFFLPPCQIPLSVPSLLRLEYSDIYSDWQMQEKTLKLVILWLRGMITGIFTAELFGLMKPETNWIQHYLEGGGKWGRHRFPMKEIKQKTEMISEQGIISSYLFRQIPLFLLRNATPAFDVSHCSAAGPHDSAHGEPHQQAETGNAASSCRASPVIWWVCSKPHEATLAFSVRWLSFCLPVLKPQEIFPSPQALWTPASLT